MNLQLLSPIKVAAKFYRFRASDTQNIAFRCNIPLKLPLSLFAIVTGSFTCFDRLKGGTVAALQPHRQQRHTWRQAADSFPEKEF